MSTATMAMASPAPTSDSELIRVEDLWRTYQMGAEEIHALRGVSFDIKRNEYVAVMGPSGSGKSTLMNLIGCLDSPSRGNYVLRGKMVSQMGDDELAVEPVLPAGGGLQAAEDVHERGLARARRAHDRDVLVARHLEVHGAQRVHDLGAHGVVAAQPLHPEHRAGLHAVDARRRHQSLSLR
jgi:energy-coupling factor transporter ATP-binding protein EcfA2